MIRSTSGGIELDVWVVPGARKTMLAGLRDAALVVRIAARPVEGAANDTLIAFLAGLFGVPRRAVRIVAGERSRRKRLAISGVTADMVQELVRAR
jgi:hypothetical protein